jgi:hypothetical protein
MRSLKTIDLMSWQKWLRLLYILIIVCISDRWNVLEGEPLSSINIKPTLANLRNHLKSFILKRWTWTSYSIRDILYNLAREAYLKPSERKGWRRTYVCIMKNLDIKQKDA